MKVFIVFMGILTAGISFVVYLGDMGRYEHDMNAVKAAAEECAAGAALLVDEAEYAEGRFVFDREAGQAYADEFVGYVFSGKNVREAVCELSFEDDSAGFGAENNGMSPAVTARVTVSTGDFFRLPFLTVDRITREARYEVVLREAPE